MSWNSCGICKKHIHKGHIYGESHTNPVHPVPSIIILQSSCVPICDKAVCIRISDLITTLKYVHLMFTTLKYVQLAPCDAKVYTKVPYVGSVLQLCSKGVWSVFQVLQCTLKLPLPLNAGVILGSDDNCKKQLPSLPKMAPIANNGGGCYLNGLLWHLQYLPFNPL